MIDLRKEMDKLIRDTGYYILLQRTSRKLRCSCWSEREQESDPKCKFCLGEGWLSKIERHKVRYSNSIPPRSRAELNVLTDVGRSWVDSRTYYLKYNTNPMVGDIIYEVGWDVNNNHKPTHIVHMFEINDVYPLRLDGGRIEYFSIAVSAETTRYEIKDIVIRSIGPIENYEFVRKG